MNFKSLALVPLLFAGMTLADNQEKPGIVVGNTETVTATVEKINKKTREVTLKGQDGNIVTIVCGDEVKNFDQIKKGDTVTAQYAQALALYVHKAGDPLTHEETAALQTAEKGQKPGMNASRTTKITAQVENIDYDTHMMTLRGPKGRTVTFKVGDEVKKFNEIKKGDKVTAHYSEAMAVNVTTPEKK